MAENIGEIDSINKLEATDEFNMENTQQKKEVPRNRPDKISLVLFLIEKIGSLDFANIEM